MLLNNSDVQHIDAVVEVMRILNWLLESLQSPKVRDEPGEPGEPDGQVTTIAASSRREFNPLLMQDLFRLRLAREWSWLTLRWVKLMKSSVFGWKELTKPFWWPATNYYRNMLKQWVKEIFILWKHEVEAFWEDL